MIDFCLNKSAITLQHDCDLVLQQVDMLFDTSPKEVLGEPDYGSDYDKFIWDLTASESTIERYIAGNIRANVDLLGFNLTVKAEVYYGTNNDIILVAIILEKEGDTFKKVYNIGG